MHEHPVDNSRTIPRSHPLYGKKTYVPRMVEGSARALAAVLRSLGVDAEVTPRSNARTLDLGENFPAGMSATRQGDAGRFPADYGTMSSRMTNPW